MKGRQLSKQDILKIKDGETYWVECWRLRNPRPTLALEGREVISTVTAESNFKSSGINRKKGDLIGLGLRDYDAWAEYSVESDMEDPERWDHEEHPGRAGLLAEDYYLRIFFDDRGER